MAGNQNPSSARNHAMSSESMQFTTVLPSSGSICPVDELSSTPDSVRQISPNVWQATVSGQNKPEFSSTSFDKCDDDTQPRSRKKKRPFSPEPIGNTRRNFKIKTKSKGSARISKSLNDESRSRSFSCDKCGALSVISPSRSRLPQSQIKKIQTARKKIDPITNRILNLCNACGLAFSRPPRLEKTSSISIDDRDRYLAQAHAFAKNIAEKVGRPAVERLYCPTFKNRPCGCIQTFISHQGDDAESTLENRVESLLQLFNTACDLNRRKNLFPEYQSLEKSKEKSITNSSECKQRQKDYEHFVLKTRQLLREKLRLCERACQRILLYSNNFLHKRLKSTPDQGSRISKQTGRSCASQLLLVQELGTMSCCSDNCSRLALTHSALLEDWRKQASLGQRQARRVLAEMLTPSGGTKSNCYKFITMVTGCGPTTISSVSHQMRVTKGNRDPPEHGLRKWYRDNPRKQIKPSTQVFNSSHEQSNESLHISSVSQIHLESTDAEDSKKQLEQQKLELEEAKRQLYLKQQELERCQQIIDEHFCQGSLPANTPNNDALWKINVLKNSVKGADTDTHLLNLPAESNLAMMSELSNGQTVQLIDLVPGTYIAVPSEFDSSTILTVSSESKQEVLSNVSSSTNNTHDQQDIILPHCLHSLEPLHKTNSNVVYSDDLQSLGNSAQSNQFIIQSENGVQTIYNISSASEAVGTILKEAECQIQPMENCNAEVFVSTPADDMFSSSAGNLTRNVSSLDTSGFQPINIQTTSSLHAVNPTDSSHPTSCPTSVITLSGNCDAGKSALHNSSVLPSAECSSLYKTVKSGSIGVFDMASSLNSVILLSSEQSQSTGNSLNSFERLFE